MTRIPEKDRDILEQAMYLPMLLTILERDRILFDKGSFKLKQPYLELIDETNPRIRNRVQELMEFYLYKRFK
ncbi:MAG: hypothetical protein ACQEXE_19735 [Bacillota bacterium]|uniref:Uncharacterized protein n=1 Tax=Cytobacillus oceanisediminis 2691 TaxID=1196031 RepID=A0A160MI78_9BACI|nr:MULTISPECIES: hypothetical protein [Cytobacillus]AND43100.1 hypothetical protein A361_28450 [Cytobacillus oceanisediminis 2691]MCM3245661.1 hypothetical protein [Cytobacillus oceanisediminis]UQX57010.1 hypothetical protein M5V91_29875 [Cytobacillus pseudoceanisediminis]USK47358.1 hypothetical protein LIT27_29740 [Cytobacillus oceanisediminis]